MTIRNTQSHVRVLGNTTDPQTRITQFFVNYIVNNIFVYDGSGFISFNSETITQLNVIYKSSGEIALGEQAISSFTYNFNHTTSNGIILNGNASVKIILSYSGTQGLTLTAPQQTITSNLDYIASSGGIGEIGGQGVTELRLSYIGTVSLNIVSPFILVIRRSKGTLNCSGLRGIRGGNAIGNPLLCVCRVGGRQGVNLNILPKGGSCRTWKFLKGGCSVLDQAKGKCNSTTGAFVPQSTLCRQNVTFQDDIPCETRINVRQS